MPLVIEEMSATLEISDEAKIRELVREEIRRALNGEGAARSGNPLRVDPTDPNAAGGGSGGD